MTQTATTLAADVSADAEFIEVAAPLSDTLDFGFLVQIGEEMMLVEYRGMGYLPGVRRHFDGTLAAPHSSGAAVTPVVLVVQTDPPTAPPPAQGGGGVQTVSLLGPFTVTFATMGIDATGGNPTTLANGGYVDVAAVPDGSEIIVAWAEPTSAWNGDGTQSLEMLVQPADDPDNSSGLGVFTTNIAVGPESGYAIATATAILIVIRTISGTHLGVVYANDGGVTPPTAGEADIYALIATPA